MFRSNVPSKIGIFARVRAGKRKKKKWWTDRTTTLQRFNRDTLLFVRVYAPCPVTRNTKISPSRASSQQLTTRPTRDAQFFISPSLCEKQQRHANISRKTLPFFLAKIYFFPAPRAISISDSRRNLAAKRGNLERTHHYVKDATSLVLRRPTRAFLHSRATSPVNSRQLALSTNS